MNKLISRNPVLRFKEGRKIIKAERGVWGKLWDLITDTDLAYMDNPAVMTAAGHTSRVSGVHAPTAEERQLGENLTEIGKAGAAAAGGEALLAVKGALSTGRAVSTVKNTRAVSNPTASTVSLGLRALPGRVSTPNVPVVRSNVPTVRGNVRPNTITVEGRTISSRTLPSRSSTLGRKVVGTTMAAYPAALLMSSDSNSENSVASGANIGASVGANIASNMPDKNRVARRHDYGKGEVTYHLDKNTGIWYAKWNDPTKPNLGWYKVAEGSTGYNRAGDHNVLRNGKWVKIDETPVKKVKSISTPLYQFGKMGGWNRGMGNTISDPESLNYLKEMGLDGLNALQIQQYINQLLGNNSVKEDNKWGNLSRAGLKALYENWKLQQKPQTQSPIGNSVIEALRSLEEIPQLSQDLLMFNNINSKTFNAPLPPRTIPYDRSMTRDIIKDITGNSAYNFTGDLRKALRQYLNGEQYNQEAIKAFGDLKQYDKYMKWRLLKGGILPSRNIVERFKNGRKIVFAQNGTGRFRVYDKNTKEEKRFNTREEAKKYLMSAKQQGTRVLYDDVKEASGQVLKVDRTKEKATQYGRQQLEKNNNLSFKQAYQAARKSGNKYFAYKGKVYKSDLENGKDNMTEMALHYGNNLGYSGDPKLGTKKSMAARALYRKDIDAKKGNRNAVYKGKTNKQVSAEADKQVAKTWDEAKFVDALMPIQTLNLPLMAMDKDYKPEIYRSGLNPLGYALDAVEGNIKGLATRALDIYTTFGAPGMELLITKVAPKIPIPTYLQQLYHGDAGSTNWAINALNRASGKTKNFLTRLVPRKGNGLFGKYSIQAAEHIDPAVTAVVNNNARQYVTGNPKAVLPLYTYFGDAATNPKTWGVLDLTNQYANNNYE